MKEKVVLACIVAALGAATASAAMPGRFIKKTPSSKIAKKIEEVRKINEAAENGSWQPGMTTLYGWNGEEWEEESVMEQTYTERGLPLTTTTQGVLMRYEYDSDSRVSAIRAYSADDPSTELMTYIFEYDPVVKNAIVKTSVSVTMMGMTLSETVGVDVKRNDSGKVTSVEQYSISMTGERSAVSSMTFEYGADGTAKKMTVMQYEDGEVAGEFWASDMEWWSTNGQMLSFGLTQEKFPVGLFDADNRLKYGRFTYLDEPDPIGLLVTYGEDGESYEMIYSVLGVAREKLSYTKSDDFGSYTVHMWEEAGLNPSDGTNTTDLIHTVDSYGLVLEERTIEKHFDRGMSWPSTTEEYAVVGHVDYASDFGYPEEYWTEEGEPESMDKSSREIYSDYEFYLSGVKEVENASSAGEPEYFNLQGVKVAHPHRGVFIERRGGDVRKIVK